jgi:hypothetical protein
MGISKHPLTKQKELIINKLATWQGVNLQLDDILIMSVKV